MGTQEHVAYAAGIVDGDGSIYISDVERDGAQLGFKVSMRHPKPVARVAGVLGGEMVGPDKKDFYRHSALNATAAKACARLLPFLTVKKSQAELGLRFQEHIDLHRHTNRRRFGSWGGTVPHPAFVQQERHVMMNEMKRLNGWPSAEPLSDVGIKRGELYAWSAGLIDAEGSVTFIRSGRGILPVVMIQMTDRRPLDRISFLFGGTVREEKRRTKRGKTVFSWRILSNSAREACMKMIPYLLAKREQAMVVILFQNNVRLWIDRVGFGSKNIPIEVRAKRDRWIDRVRAMNAGSHHKRAAAETKSEHPETGSYSPSIPR